MGRKKLDINIHVYTIHIPVLIIDWEKKRKMNTHNYYIMVEKLPLIMLTNSHKRLPLPVTGTN